MKKAQNGGWSSCARTITAVCIMAVLWPVFPLRADLQELSADQMAAISGAGFSNFTVDGNRVRADFNIAAETYTEIDSLKMGYWDNGNGLGWDQDWTQVVLGTAAEDLLLSGFYIEATFENLSDPVNRRLLSVFFGFNQASGDLTANFASLSKIGVGGDEDSQRLNLGVRTFRFNDSEIALSFQLEGLHRGIWVRFGDGTTLN